MSDSEHSISELSRFYFLFYRGSEEYEWARDEIERIYNEDLEKAWMVTLALIDAAPSLNFLYDVAAGELEMLVRDHGSQIAHRIRNEALTNSKFLYAMTGVWLVKENAYFNDFKTLLETEIRSKEDFEDLEIRCNVPGTIAFTAQEPINNSSKALKKIEELRKELKNAPEIFTPYLEIANICFHELPEQTELATSAIKIYLEHEPDSANGLFTYARILGRVGDELAAEKMYKNVIGIDPWHKDAILGLGNLLFSQKRCSEAQQLFRQAVEWYGISPGLGELSARYFLAQASLECGEKEEAIQQLKIISQFKNIYPWEEAMKLDATEKLHNLGAQEE
ncbi:MAG: hypothetical protein IAF58_03650 [Leptolyngbya sp.]|nr:hypothetical protein [Candidatus Melainabacteria bacterium]